MGVISLRDRLEEEQAARRREAAKQPPAIFLVGVVMMIAVVGGLMLRGAIAGGAVAVAGSASPSAIVLAGSPTPAVTASMAPYRGLTGYVWPLDNPVVTLPYGPTDWGEFFVNGIRFHDGVDVASDCGDKVHAAHDGVVLAASRQYDDYMGWTSSLTPYYNLLTTKHWWDSLPIVIVIDDGDGYRSIYAHEYQVLVKAGQKVKAGDVIGFEGQTGNASGCHVHFGLFSTTETARLQLDPAIVSKDQMPAEEISRIDPLLVLPFRCDIEETRTLRPIEAAACPPWVAPTPTAKGGAKATPKTSAAASPRL
jgi:murein DD-endopeptidase MepM/ murein hydrolase activator NlpD